MFCFFPKTISINWPFKLYKIDHFYLLAIKCNKKEEDHILYKHFYLFTFSTPPYFSLLYFENFLL